MRSLACHFVKKQSQGLQCFARTLRPFRRTIATDGPLYEHINVVERLDGYRPGGYHPVQLNDKLQERYSIIEKLGYGSYSTIWLARDEKLSRYVAVKIGIANHSSKEAQVLEQLSACPTNDWSDRLIPLVLDRFELTGPNGTHSCLVTTPARCSLVEALKDYDLFPLNAARSLAAQLIIAVAHIHLGNLLLQLPGKDIDKLTVNELYKKYGDPEAEPVVRVDKQPITSLSVPAYAYTPAWLGKPAEEVTLSEAKLMLTDLGTAFSPAHETRLQSFTPRKTRPPEPRFDPTTPLSYASDIWSLGCIIWEILGVRPFLDIFLPELDDVTANQIDALGPLPDEWWDAWDGKWKRFVANGQPTEGRQPWTFDQRFEDAIQGPRRRRKWDTMDERESKAFCELIKDILKFRPGERPTAEDILRSQWMTE
ncbi:hypothetical protein BN1723_003855 [Verticillium longisporum]|uniref:Protein kinase domain-containing protein n=1 Tax=Verticillium longisporum TaxID=100787 RepID=A0A0G4MDE4_VERLO|nr:hypothetical protein BN1723_003855 [Verticillium longisporum]